MKKIETFYNHGRWIADCPVCKASNQVSLGDEMFVCGNCYQGKMARKFKMRPDGTVTMGFDRKKQDAAKAIALANGDVYELVFPKQATQIEKLLRLRRTDHQSWLPGETVNDLKKENNELPLLSYIQKKGKKAITDVPALDPELARRIK